MDDLAGLYALPPGADFPAELVAGLLERFDGQPPEAMAQVELVVNTARMRRRITELLSAGPARFLPRIRLVTELAVDPLAPPVPVTSPLRRLLRLAQLVDALLARDTTLAPRTDAFALAESLVTLLAEMEDEGVSPDRVADLDVGDLSAHWKRSREFLKVVTTYLQETQERGVAAALRAAVTALAARWATHPPGHPVILAGSTGSRGTTQMLMQAVARLPCGAVVLPGFDFDLPPAVWDRLKNDPELKDHPQYRFAALLSALDRAPPEVRRWRASDPVRARNAVVSLALRPAPVTDQWLSEGAHLPALDHALSGLSLIEAADPRHEALSIALCLRAGIEKGKTVALITPDRVLARRVAAELDRWRLLPDDSAGRPLDLSAPGRFLRQIAQMAGRPIEIVALVALLKHPLTHSGASRNEHLRRTRTLELELRRSGRPDAGMRVLADWAERAKDDGTRAWALWLTETLATLSESGERSLSDHLTRHRALAERMAQGAFGHGSGELWLEAAGVEALKAMDKLADAAEAGGTMDSQHYARLLDRVLADGEVREAMTADPRAMIWGTLEARVQGADLVVLGGLNDGVWPPLPGPDPWLNRRMRREAGLLSPERRVGLSAHDFQQAIAAPEVVLSRAKRDDDTETVMSRWLNRLYNLVQGLKAGGGPKAWTEMQVRGARWTNLARRMDPAPADPGPGLAPAPRPSPRPPVGLRPKTLSVTQIQTLIRDPYAIYARHVLGLKRLDSLRPEPDARLRGTVIHKVMERFTDEGIDPTDNDAADRLVAIARAVMEAEVAWPEIRILWAAQVARVAPAFLADEVDRRSRGAPRVWEAWGRLPLPEVDFTLKGKIDRIDKLNDGRAAIYDYKTGNPPSAKQVKLFDRQLFLSAAMIEFGTVDGIDPAEVALAGHIGLGSSPKAAIYPARDPSEKTSFDPAQERADLARLIAAFREPSHGYASRRAMEMLRFEGDYDHLARFGEWDATDKPKGIDLT